MYSIQAACFIFPRLVAPCSPFPPPPEPSLFPSAPFLALGMGGFLWGRTFLLILLRDNQSLPAVLSLCSPCTGNFFFCISVNCLATHSFAQAEAQYQPRPHPHSMARSGPWWCLRGSHSPTVCPSYGSGLLTGLRALIVHFFNCRQELFKNVGRITSSHKFFVFSEREVVDLQWVLIAAGWSPSPWMELWHQHSLATPSLPFALLHSPSFQMSHGI